MPEGTVILGALTTVVSTLATVIAVLWKKSEARWETYVNDLKASIAALQSAHLLTLDRMEKQYQEQLRTALTDKDAYKEFLGLALHSGNVAVDVGVEQAKRLPRGGR